MFHYGSNAKSSTIEDEMIKFLIRYNIETQERSNRKGLINIE